MGRQEKNWLERRIEALEDQEDHLEGWVKAEVKRFEQLKNDPG